MAHVLVMAGANKNKIKERAKKVTPEIMAIHSDIDSWSAILQGGARTSVEQKNNAAKEIGNLVRKLQKMGAIEKINVN